MICIPKVRPFPPDTRLRLYTVPSHRKMRVHQRHDSVRGPKSATVNALRATGERGESSFFEWVKSTQDCDDNGVSGRGLAREANALGHSPLKYRDAIWRDQYG